MPISHAGGTRKLYAPVAFTTSSPAASAIAFSSPTLKRRPVWVTSSWLRHSRLPPGSISAITAPGLDTRAKSRTIAAGSGFIRWHSAVTHSTVEKEPPAKGRWLRSARTPR